MPVPRRARTSLSGRRDGLLNTASVGPPHAQLLQEVVANHVRSFNFMLDKALPLAVKSLHPVELEADGVKATVSFGSVEIAAPTEYGSFNRVVRAVYPSECRERRISYKGRLQTTIKVHVHGSEQPWEFQKNLGAIPVMVKSKKCHLNGLNPEQLIQHHEEAEEMGGYFVINGNEKIVRMLILPRRNQVMALVRPSFTKRGNGYTEFGCSIRCVRPDQTSHSLVLHYRTNGTCTVGFSHRKQQYLVPAVVALRALLECSDREVFDAIVQGDNTNTFLVERVQLMLSERQGEQLYSREQCLRYLGSKFKVVMNVSADLPDDQVGLVLLERLFFVHLDADDARGKFDVLVLMIRKLYHLVAGDCTADNADSAMNQELLVPGHLYVAVVKEQLQEYILNMRKIIATDVQNGKPGVSFSNQAYFKKRLLGQAEIGKKVEFLMATGNLLSPTGLDLMQQSGFTIVADKLNFTRYVSHFRCVHRGAFFTTMKTTTVRKLLPESWGFLCPVHTPDGAPCGLLNHITASCYAVNEVSDTSRIAGVLSDLGLLTGGLNVGKEDIIVCLDGRVLGHTAPTDAQLLADQLRMLKISGDISVPETLEIALVLPSVRGQYPGLYLFSQPARMIRPVRNLRADKVELIGTFEQVYMDIAVTAADFVQGVTTHVEEAVTNFISVVANMTPFSDHNQSPRNMWVTCRAPARLPSWRVRLLLPPQSVKGNPCAPRILHAVSPPCSTGTSARWVSRRWGFHATLISTVPTTSCTASGPRRPQWFAPKRTTITTLTHIHKGRMRSSP